MRRINIGFSSPINNPFPVFSWVIKAVYNTPYSHSYMRFHSTSLERDIIYESVGVGVRFVGSKVWNEQAKTIKEFEIEMTDEQYKELFQFCVDQAGKKYGKRQVAGIYIAKLFRMKKNIFKNDLDQQICSEIIGRILSKLGYVLNKDFDLLVPKDIYEALEKGLPK